MRWLILGNSGSGKSFLAKALAGRHGIPHLDLDTLVWEPREIAVARPVEEVEADLQAFLASNPAWVVEGCYEGFLAGALPFCTELVYLNPGLEACLENTRRRPWEPHKYEREEDQRRLLPMLSSWVAGHYLRTDAWSSAAHRRLFDGFQGPKREITEGRPKDPFPPGL
jgi:adenylate kinase family enzyme